MDDSGPSPVNVIAAYQRMLALLDQLRAEGFHPVELVNGAIMATGGLGAEIATEAFRQPVTQSALESLAHRLMMAVDATAAEHGVGLVPDPAPAGTVLH